MSKNSHDVVLVGAGVIGLASAWACARRGMDVCVLERDRPAAGATGVAAGMLAPVGEASWGEESVLSLNRNSLERWPKFAEDLEADAGLQVEFAARGALHVALDRDEGEELQRRHRLHRSLGLDSDWLSGRECRELEPGLATAVRGGVHVPGEASVDPRRLTAALLAALEGAGGAGSLRRGGGGGRAQRGRLGTANGRRAQVRWRLGRSLRGLLVRPAGVGPRGLPAAGPPREGGGPRSSGAGR